MKSSSNILKGTREHATKFVRIKKQNDNSIMIKIMLQEYMIS